MSGGHQRPGHGRGASVPRHLFRSLGDEGGSVSVVAAAMIALLFLVVLLAADAGRLLATAARAQTAADAAALAAAQELAIPSDEDAAALASEYARRNGGSLVECACSEGTNEATVRVGVNTGEMLLLPERTVEARARAVVGAPPG